MNLVRTRLTVLTCGMPDPMAVLHNEVSGGEQELARYAR